jgi:hypothetical protein
VRISQPPTTSGLTADADIDMLTLYQLKRLAAPASGEALRKGNPDITDTEVDDAAAIAYWKLALTGGITNDDIASDAAIAVSKLASTPILESLLTTRGDIIYRGASAAARLPKGTEGQYLQQGANDPQWASIGAPATVVRKTANETVNNSNVLQNDDHLLLAIAANEEWVFEIVLFITEGMTDCDIQVALTVPAGASVKYGLPDASVNTANAIQYGTLKTASGTAVTCYGNANTIVHIVGWVLNGATAGNLQLQWAQATAGAFNLTVAQGSYLIAHKLS